MSFSRPPGRVTDDILGSTTNCPFWPGGLDPPIIPEIEDADINLDAGLLLLLIIISSSMTLR